MHCPSLNLFGTFFPAWMFCVLVGLFGTIVAHLLLALVGVQQHVKPQLLVYPSIALTITFLVWLVRYGA